MERKLATIRKINNIVNIEGADKICTYVIDGWNIVDQKNKYQINELVVMVEVDSWVPHTLAPFLTKNYPKVFKGVEGNRLKTIKLRGQLSQGLILPLSTVEDILGNPLRRYQENEDMTNILGIIKWEKDIPAALAGMMRGDFPVGIPKTDQERIQNLTKKIPQWNLEGGVWEVTEKLEGSSCTMYLDLDGEFHVCSRNINLKFDENNSFWQMAIKYKVEEKLRSVPELLGVAIQGELVGPGVQGNIYNLPELDFYVYDLYHVKDGYCPAPWRHDIVDAFEMKHVPLMPPYVFENASLEDFLAMADGQSQLGSNPLREGLVFKSMDDPSISFKVISNQYCLKHDL